MNQTGQFQLGIDIGGTFTDFSLSDRDLERLCVHKQLSTPDDPLQAVREGLGVLLSKAGVQLAAVSRITHATTLVANAVLERKGDATGMLCTKGFISALDIGREQRYDLYDMRISYPEPLVPLPLRREIDERINSKGEIETALPEQAVLEAVRELTGRHGITPLPCVSSIPTATLSMNAWQVKSSPVNFPVFPSPPPLRCFLPSGSTSAGRRR